MKTHLRIPERHSKVALLASTTAVLVLVLGGGLFAAERDARTDRAPAAISIPSNDAGNLVGLSAPPAALWHELFAN